MPTDEEAATYDSPLASRRGPSQRQDTAMKNVMYGKAATRITILLATVAALGAPRKW